MTKYSSVIQPPATTQCLVLLSGGMDSVTALHWALKHHNVIAAVSFDYGSKHNHCEIPCAQRQCSSHQIRHEVVDLGFMNRLFTSDLLKSGADIPDGHYEEPSMARTVVPFRNGIMLSIACGLAESWGANTLVIAAHSGDHAIYPDCREPFMTAMASAMLEGSYKHVELLRPFIDMDKAAIVLKGIELGVDYRDTWSCYKGLARHCGTCGTCVERKEAFQQAGVDDPTIYL